MVLAESASEALRECALKIRFGPKGSASRRTRKEYLLLSRLHHPAIVSAYDCGVLRPEEVRALVELVMEEGPADPPLQEPAAEAEANREWAFLALEPVCGGDLRSLGSRLAAGDALADWRPFLQACAQAASALAHLHALGWIHFDVKPENILVAGLPGPGDPPQIKFIDFGLCEQDTTPVGTRVRGSAPYIAPELFEGGAVDHRADLFSLGVTFFNAATGVFPFPGETPEAWLEAARSGRRVRLLDRAPGAPPEFSELIDRLLDPSPERRPQTAREVHAAIERLLGTTSGRGGGTWEFLTGTPPILGFERELKVLEAELEQLEYADTHVSLVLIQGDSGHYVHRLVEEASAAAKAMGLECIQVTAAAPRRAPFDPIAEAAAGIAKRIDLEAPRWQPYLPALRLLAGLDLAPGGTEREAEAISKSRTRFLDRISDFFVEVGRTLPFVILIRDLHHADIESLEVLASIARRLHLEREEFLAGPLGAAPLHSSRLLLVATFRELESAVEGPEQSRLRSLALEPFTLGLRLRDLPMERLREWVQARTGLGRIPHHFIERLYKAAQGSPRLTDELLARSAERSDLSGDDRLESADFFSLPRELDEAIVDRAKRLPDWDRQLLEILAAQGNCPLPCEVLEEALRLFRTELTQEAGSDPAAGVPCGETGFLEHVEALAARGYVEIRHDSAGPSVLWAVEEAREKLLHEMPPARFRALHRALYRALSAADSRQSLHHSEALAYLAAGAGLAAECAGALRRAAERWREAHAIHSAAQLYERYLERAKHAQSGATPEDLRAASGTLAELYLQSGRPRRAVEKLTVLLSLEEGASDPVRLGSIHRRIGEAYLETGESGNAQHFLEKSLRLLARTGGDCTGTRLALERAKACIALARYHLRREEPAAAEKHIAEVFDLTSGLPGEFAALLSEANRLLAQVYEARGDRARNLSLNIDAVAAAELSGDAGELSKAISALGNAYVARGEYDKAVDTFRRGVLLCQEAGSKQDLARFYRSLGTIYHNRGDHSRALEYIHRSLRICREIDDVRGVAQCYNNLGNVYRLRDEFDKARESYKQAIDLLARVDDQAGMAAGMTNLSGVLEQEGRYNEALEYAFRALEKRKRFSSRSGIAFSYYRIGRIYESKGELEKALSYARKSLQIRTSLGERMGIAYSELQLAGLLLAAGRLGESLERARNAVIQFRRLENLVGELWARELHGRVLIRLGAVEEAVAELEQVLPQAQEEEQQGLVANCLLSLGLAAGERSDFAEAERRLVEAERLHRRLRNRRQLAETLLESSALKLELGHTERAEAELEEAYALIEELGLRDLAVRYFLERGRLEAESGRNPPDAARKFFQRGLMEARETRLPDLLWRFHYRLALLERDRGDPHLARVHFEEAVAVLNELAANVPPAYEERFRTSREREELRNAVEEETAAGPKPSLAGARSETPPPARARPPLGNDAKLRERLDKLREVASAVGSERDLDTLLEKIMDALIDLSEAERGFLILKGDGSGAPYIAVARNIEKERILDPDSKISHTIAKEVLESGRAVIAGNAFGEERFAGLKSVQDLRLRSLVCLPLRFRERILGVIYLDHRGRRDAFDDWDLKVLETFCDQAAVAVTNARLIREKEDLNLKLHQKVHRRSVQLAIAQQDVRKAQSELASRYTFGNIVGRSKRMLEIFALLERLSQTQLPVLLQGESGTGKELIARAIHFSSPRREGRFVSENCGALTESLLETELFGHKRGAFTGAIAEKKGLFELAHGGTLFLDEVGDMSLGMQQKLLRALESGEIRPVGSKDIVKVDVRVISASNKNLEELVAEGKFREDLFYRLNGVRIELPPLRERREDIPLLVEHFLNELARESGGRKATFHPEALRLLEEYDWPGNVRELRHFVEKTVLFARSEVIGPDEIRFDGIRAGRHRERPAASPASTGKELPSYRAARDAFEREYVEAALARAGGNVTLAARLSGLSRESFYRLLRKHGVRRKPTGGSAGVQSD